MIQQFCFWVFIQRNENTIYIDKHTPCVHCSFICNRQDMEAAKVSIDKGMTRRGGMCARECAV